MNKLMEREQMMLEMLYEKNEIIKQLQQENTKLKEELKTKEKEKEANNG